MSPRPALRARLLGLLALLLALPATLLLTPPAEAADPVVTVYGGVFDALGDPVSGVTVQALSAPGYTAVASSTASDAEGAFELDLPPGTFRVTFSKTGFRTSTYGGSDEPASVVVTEDADGGGAVTVDGAPLEEDYLGDETLVSTTTRAITGLVRNASGPIANIVVSAFDTTDTSNPVSSFTTTATGRFTLNVPIGYYNVSYVDSGTTYVSTWYPGAAAPGSELTVRATGPVQVDGEDIACTPATTNTLCDVTMTAAPVDASYPLAGMVVDANFDPLAGVTVTGVAQAAGGTTATATSDDDGLFSLSLKPGSYQVKYERAAHTTAWYLDPDDDTGTVRATVTVTSNGTIKIGTATLNNGLDPVILKGTATHAVSGTVVDQAGAAIAGITVEAVLEGQQTPAATALTGPGGAWTLSLLVGTYTIRFVDNDGTGATYTVAYLGGADPTSIKVETGGQVLADNTAVTGPTAPVELVELDVDATYPLSGTVVDINYDPVAGARVAATPVPGTGTPSDNAVAQTTGADGTYALELRPGTYYVRYTADGFQPAWLGVEPSTPVALTVSDIGLMTAPNIEFEDPGVLYAQLLLMPAPEVVTAPKVSGRLVVGQKVSVSFGTWTPNISSWPAEAGAFVEWFVAGKADNTNTGGDYGETFTPPASAAGKPVTYRITIFDPVGERGDAIYDGTAGTVAKAKSTLTAGVAKKVLKVVVKVPGIPKPTGKVTVLDGKKKLATLTLAAAKKGVATLNLAKLAKAKPGKHKLTITYAGAPGIGGVKKVLKITL